VITFTCIGLLFAAVKTILNKADNNLNNFCHSSLSLAAGGCK